MTICTWVTSLVERVMRLAVENRPISSMEKDCTAEKSRLRSVPEKPVAIRAAHTAVRAEAHRLPRAHSSILPPAARMSAIWLPGVLTKTVMRDI